MKSFFLILGGLVLILGCTKEKKGVDYSLYNKMDRVKLVDKVLRPRKKSVIPFHYNQIYDPFIKKNKGINTKANYKKGLWTELNIIVLDTIKTNINVASRKSSRPNKVQGFPVIIENESDKRTMSVPLHRGCAKIIQEAKNKEGDWVEIEDYTQEKLGNFYYQIPPKQFIYTKIPIYYGKDTTEFRVGLVLEDTTFYSNTYKSTVQKWMLRK